MTKILIITEGYFPGKNYGGPPVSINNLCMQLQGEVEVFIITTDHDFKEKIRYKSIQPGWNKRNECNIYYCSEKEYGYNTFNSLITEIKPDFVYLQSIFQRCVLSVLLIAKLKRIKVLLAPRGELCAGAIEKKKLKKVLYLIALRYTRMLNGVYFQSTSQDETEAINKYCGKSSQITLLSNIPSKQEAIINPLTKKVNQAKFVFVSRIVWKKNLYFALEILKSVGVGNVVFDIYGSIEDKDYWENCLDAIKSAPHNLSINYRGVCEHEHISETLSRYDALLFPTYSENYGHIIAESLSVGLPVIISDQTPWSDINVTNAGWAISLNDTEKFKDAVKSIIKADSEKMKEKSISALNYFTSKTDLVKLRYDYLKLFSQILNS